MPFLSTRMQRLRVALAACVILAGCPPTGPGPLLEVDNSPTITGDPAAIVFGNQLILAHGTTNSEYLVTRTSTDLNAWTTLVDPGNAALGKGATPNLSARANYIKMAYVDPETSAVKVAQLVGAFWATGEIASAPGTQASAPSIVVTSQLKDKIAYFTGGGTLAYATKNGSGVWEETIIDYSDSHMSFEGSAAPMIAVHNKKQGVGEVDDAWIFYMVRFDKGAASSMQLRVAIETAGTWKVYALLSGLGPNSRLVGVDMTPPELTGGDSLAHIVIYNGSPRREPGLSYWTMTPTGLPERVYYEEVTTSSPLGGTLHSLDVADGVPTIAFVMDDGKLQISKWNGSQWITVANAAASGETIVSAKLLVNGMDAKGSGVVPFLRNTAGGSGATLWRYAATVPPLAPPM